MTGAVAVAGLGAIGSRIGARIHRAGYETVAWNRTAAATQHLVRLGATAVSAPAQAAARFRLPLARKDTDLMITAADLADGGLPVAQSVRCWLLKADGEGRGDEDYTALVAAIANSRGDARVD